MSSAPDIRTSARRSTARRRLPALGALLLSLWASAAVAAPLTLRIAPHDFLVPSHGSQPLTVEAHANGRPVSGPIVWSVRPASAGRVGTDNVFVAGATPGEAVIRASLTVGGRTGTAWAHVRVGQQGRARPTRSLVVTPRQARVAVNGTLAFFARPLDGAPPAGGTTWRVIPPSAGRVDANGTFTAGATASQCEVVAVAHDAGGQASGIGNARVVIVAGELAGTPGTAGRVDTNFHVQPARAVLAAGDTRQFSTTLGADTRATVKWSVQPASLGSVSADGTFTAGLTASGGGVVIATATLPNGRTARAAAAVQIGRDASRTLSLRPQFQRVPAGGAAEFQVTGLPAAASATARVRWIVKPETGGTITPSGALGLFTAGRTRGEVRIEAHVSNADGRERVLTSVVQVVDASVLVDVVPTLLLDGPTTLRLAQTVTYRLAATGMGSGDLAGVDVQWSVTPSLAGRLVSSGRKATVQFRPLVPGVCVITATATFNGVTKIAVREVVVTP